ncbi:unnamed protein product, partial [marine sediment metagenome]
ANAFAKDLKVPTNRITGILNQTRAITPDTALRLAEYFGTTAKFWLNLQMEYDLKLTEKNFGKKIKREVLLRKVV